MKHFAIRSVVIGSLVAGAGLAWSGTAAQAQNWVSIAVDSAGHWGWQFAAGYQASRLGAISNCSAPGCRALFTERAWCMAFAESHAGGYWYGDAYGSDRRSVISIAMGGCRAGAPAGTCQLTRWECQGG